MDERTPGMEGMIAVEVEGPRLDVAAVPEFRRRLSELVEAGETQFLLDFSRVEFIDSSGVGAIVAIMKLAGRHARIELGGLQPPVRTVFRLTRMDQVFRIHETVRAG